MSSLHALFNVMFVPVKGSHKRGNPVSRDPAALVAKYSDPLVLHGTADRVTDPLASQDLYNDAQEVRCWQSCKCE
ncbi:hypothetical protein A4A49_66070 [Nicotiana attenuata]|uniref:Serine aminopeptidase S33 domain-containing protein n=1 Tax=Nicotiana attenuata TaxID=49451 RepID=A0A314L9T3_NICAT|nr:hypothetical protein A4A49_66070 [Nicotiana attenuata]